MDRKETQNAIEVMQAFLDGAEIQVCLLDGMGWIDNAPPSPEWNWRGCLYRIKPPEPREWWINVYHKEDMSCRAHPSKERAERSHSRLRTGCVKVREVIE